MPPEVRHVPLESRAGCRLLADLEIETFLTLSPYIGLQNRFPGNDPSQQPYGELHKVPLEGFPQGPHQHRPMQPHRQSLGDMSNWEEPRPPAEDVNAPWLYEQTNTMLRDLHFERLQRQGHPG